MGGGPAACTLGALLAEKGVETVLFSNGKRPDLIVGESLIPALIPIFQRLGIEEEVAEIGNHKPGATFCFGPEDEFTLSFHAVRGLLPTYAYNVPRPAFDAILARRARKAGVREIPVHASIKKGTSGNGNREIYLDENTLGLVPEWEGKQPDLVVDCSGRARMAARLLDIPTRVGPRKDVAYFAHYTGFEPPEPAGQLVVDRLVDGGWSWRIPLKDRMSVGVVMNKKIAKSLGDSPEDRLETAIKHNPSLKKAGMNRERVSEVLTYTNYQLIAERGFGPGWVALGDAFGFVDPMLSPGLFIAMWGAERLADVIPARTPLLIHADLEDYSRKTYRMIDSWQRLVEVFYDGSLFSVYKSGNKISMTYPGRISDMIERHIEKNLSGMASGALTDKAYSQRLLKLLVKHGIRGFEPADLAIK